VYFCRCKGGRGIESGEEKLVGRRGKGIERIERREDGYRG